MRHETLRQIIGARGAKRPVALVTELSTGHQNIVYGDALPPRDRRPGSLPGALYDAVGRGFGSDRSAHLEIDGVGYFVQVFNPPLRMFVIGAVHIAQSLVPMAALLGYEITVIDPRSSFASDDRFPAVAISTDWPDEALERFAPDARSAIITLTHDPKIDDPALATALRSDAFYIGSLGSIRTHRLRLERLRREGYDAAAIGRIHGPIGLDIGARSPAEIATAILGQVTSVLRRGPRESGQA